MPDSSSFHIYSCLFLNIKKCSPCHVVILKVKGSPWDLNDRGGLGQQ